MSKRLGRMAVVLAASAAIVALSTAPPAGAEQAGAERAGALSAPVTREWITVSASSYATTYATLRAYGMRDGKKVEVLGPWKARVGYRGIAKAGQKREGDGKTPSGTYGFGFFFGIGKDPGVSFRYRLVNKYDYWADDPSSKLYNEWVDIRKQNPGKNPEPMDDPPFYDYGAVIAYNAARTPGLGSAIFLQVSNGGDTAGCVALPAGDLLKILRWMTPADNPRITITG